MPQKMAQNNRVWKPKNGKINSTSSAKVTVA